jgi:apolipoprotein N-acyltransferase
MQTGSSQRRDLLLDETTVHCPPDSKERMSSRKKTKPRRVRCADQNEGLPGGRRPGSKHAAPAGDPADKVRTGQRSRTSARLIGTLVEIRTRRAVLLLTGLSLGMSCLLFPPVDGWWLAYVCLVPWLVCVCTAERARFVYFASLLMGLGFFGVHIRWLAPVTTPGYLALCVGFSVFFPLAAWPIRHMVRRHRVSVALTAPIAWVAMEYLRSITALGFPWALLGHSQYKILTVIQISDLVGAYGVSFVLVMVNGWITDLLIQPILIWRSAR